MAVDPRAWLAQFWAHVYRHIAAREAMLSFSGWALVPGPEGTRSRLMRLGSAERVVYLKGATDDVKTLFGSLGVVLFDDSFSQECTAMLEPVLAAGNVAGLVSALRAVETARLPQETKRNITRFIAARGGCGPARAAQERARSRTSSSGSAPTTFVRLAETSVALEPGEVVRTPLELDHIGISVMACADADMHSLLVQLSVPVLSLFSLLKRFTVSGRQSIVS